MPKGRENWRLGSAMSFLVHFGLLLLLLPLALTGDVTEIAQGAGGAGPAGGGGGGNRGTGAMKEVLRFVRIAPPMPAPVAAKVVTPPPPIPQPPTPQPEPVVPTATDPVLPTGSNGRTGTDNTGGTGVGSGGGVGTGIGTGRGSAVGPGTGGGTQPNYPPTPTELFIPPLPVPESVRGFHVVAEFDVDERGRVLGLTFTPTRDRGYNRRLGEVLRGFRFRPGTRPDGTPIRMKAQVTIDLP